MNPVSQGIAAASLLTMIAFVLHASTLECRAESKPAKQKLAAVSNLPDPPAQAATQKLAPPSTAEQTQAAKKEDALIHDQAAAINKLPGATVRTEDLSAEQVEKKKGFKLSDLNPLSWILKPITKLQEQTVRLEQQIVKLVGPIAALQPGMLGLEKKMEETGGAMSQVRDQMGLMHKDLRPMQKDLSVVASNMHTVSTNLGPMRKEVGALSKSLPPMSRDLRTVAAEMSSMRSDMHIIANQMSSMQGELITMRTHVSRLERPIKDLREPVVGLQKPISRLESPLQTVGGRMEHLQSELTELKVLMQMVLTSIFISAGLIALGTPVAAILVWRNRHKLLPKPDPKQAREEAIIGKVAAHPEKAAPGTSQSDDPGTEQK